MEKSQILDLLDKFKESKFLPEPVSEEILTSYNIFVPPACVVRTSEEGKKFVNKIGWPVVLKVVSPQVIHKSDAGGVITNVGNDKEFEESFEQILNNVKNYNPEVEIEGVYVQKMISSTREVIIGTTKDEQFGPVIMFGVGGVFVEIFKDVVFRVAPVSKEEAERMVSEIQGFPILKGTRGEKPIDFDSLYSTISNISKIAFEFQQIKELDVNPVSVLPSGVCALDARIILE